LHVDLHWLDVPERVKYKLVTMVYSITVSKVRLLRSYYCTPISDVASRRHLVLPVVVNYSALDTISPHMIVELFCRGSGCLELPERRTAWTVVYCQFQTVT